MNMVHVACVDISRIDEGDYRRLYTRSSTQRQQQADRYLRLEDKHRCVTADALLRYAVQKALSTTDFEVAQGSFGKPYIKNAENFHYNLSHSGHWVVIAYGDSPVGIDVEQIRMDAPKEHIAHRFFTAEEQEYIFQSPEDCRTERFFQIWTAKESYLKYLGTGLRRALNSFSVLGEGAKLGIRLHSTFLDNYCLTLCSESETHTMEQLTLQQLTQHKE
jgi:4'-phosphopantetheinyl transferase